jgi:multicomponent Na+:H+ antiporter subunit E
MDSIDHETHPIHLATGIITYFPWLIWKIILANWDVAKVILLNNSSIRPRLMRIKASQISEVGLVTYANSITLTPGTVTLDVEGENFLIHSLTEGSYNDLLSGEMDQRITSLEFDKLGPKTTQQPALKNHPEDLPTKLESET